MNSPVTDELKLAQQVVLSAWCETEGVEYISHRYSELFDNYSVRYIQEGIEASYQFKFDHPFCHELIKGLDDPTTFFEALAYIETGITKDDPAPILNIAAGTLTANLYSMQDIFCASVDQLCLAYAAMEA